MPCSCRAHAVPLPCRAAKGLVLLSEAYQSQMQVASLLNCWTSCSDISGYNAEFHEGHCTVGAWQGHGMAWTRHGHGMLCVLTFNERPK